MTKMVCFGALKFECMFVFFGLQQILYFLKTQTRFAPRWVSGKRKRAWMGSASGEFGNGQGKSERKADFGGSENGKRKYRNKF